MKKTYKITFLIFILIFVISITSCSTFGIYNYTGWKTVELPECGIIKIPKDWNHIYEDGLNYIFKDGKLIIAEYSNPNVYDWNECYDKYHGTFFYKDTLGGFTTDYSSMLLTEIFLYQEKEMSLYRISLCCDPKDKELVVWDTNISEHILSKLCWSFRSFDLLD